MRPDWQGSIALVADNAGQAVFATNAFDEYGIPGAYNAGRFQYTGQAWEPELGMYYYKARFYSPTLGRFLQTDPIGYKDQVNLYAYVGNDPVNIADPSGLTQECVASTGGAPGSCWPAKADTEDDAVITVTARKLRSKPVGGTANALGNTGPIILGPRFAPGNGQPQNLSDQLPDAKPLDFSCLGSALKKNSVSLGFDVLGVLAGFAPGGSAGVALAQITVGAGSAVNSGMQKDTTGMVINFNGMAAALFTPAAQSAGGRLAKAVPGVGSALSAVGVVRDLAATKDAYDQCVARAR